MILKKKLIDMLLWTVFNVCELNLWSFFCYRSTWEGGLVLVLSSRFTVGARGMVVILVIDLNDLDFLNLTSQLQEHHFLGSAFSWSVNRLFMSEDYLSSKMRLGFSFCRGYVSNKHGVWWANFGFCYWVTSKQDIYIWCYGLF